MGDRIPSIPEFYRGRKIFVTGGSGFMGKVLVEKLLRSCPEVDKIYLLLRHKKGKAPASRIADIIKDVLFDTLRRETPRAFDKLVPVPGDVTEFGLGLSDRDRKLLQAEVEVVFHSAASVRFDDPLHDAILINVRGPKEMVDLALGMQHLRAFLHVSTTFCNVDKPRIEERIHPVAGDWKVMLKLVENGENDHVLRCLKSKILGKLPNTYTYTKALGEQVINDYKDMLPLVIVRPSIVLPPKFQSTIGWIDNVNGPVAFWLAAYVTLVNVLLLDPKNRLSYVPVDQAINSFIFIAWHRALTINTAEDPLPVFNCCDMTNPINEEEVVRQGFEFYREHPSMKTIRYPAIGMTASKASYSARIILFSLIPYFLLDSIARLMGEKPRLVKFLRRVYAASLAMAPFTASARYNFSSERFRQLEEHMLPDDRKDFWYAKQTDIDTEYIAKIFLFLRVNLLNDPLETLPAARTRLRRLYCIEYGVKYAMFAVVLWAVGTTSLLQWALSACSTLLYQLLND